jgi:hypothetical protein
MATNKNESVFVSNLFQCSNVPVLQYSITPLFHR